MATEYQKKALELAKTALMEKRAGLARQMAECDQAYKALSEIQDEPEKQ